MKKVVLFFMLIGTYSAFSQSACRCDAMFGSCSIRCGEGEVASCGETWYHGCSCECKEKIMTAPEVQASLYKIDLKKVKIMQDFFDNKDEFTSKKIERLFIEMSEYSENFIFKTKNQSLHDKYFNKLREYFDLLTQKDQKDLYELIELS
jgi:hypothetical protein